MVTINGSGFSANPAENIVTFAGADNTPVPAIVTTATATLLQVTVPNGVVTGPVVVRVASRSSIGVQFTAPNSNPAPADTSISPSRISGSILPVEVRISGTGFQSNSVVEYDGVPTAYNFVNATSLVITLQVFQLTQGLHRIQVVNPPPGGGTSNLLELTVTSLANQAPVVNAGSDQTITLPASASLNGTASDDGLPAGSTLTTTWSKVSGPGNVTFGNVNALTTTASFSAAGTYVLRLTASDSALSSTANITITVNPTSAVNQPATVNAGPNQTITLPASASLNGTASDDGLPAGSTLTTTWSKVSGPGTVTFGNVNALTTTASFSAAGTYVLRLTASDGALSSRDDVTITVNSAGGNANPPVVDAGPAKVIPFPAKDLTLFGHATDPDNDPLTVQWTSTSGPAPVGFSAPWALATTVSFTATGTYTFQLAASDGTSTVTSSTTVTVNSASSQTAFYVDPTVTSAGSGTAASPWKSFEDGNSNQTAQWNAIDSALATNDVIVYFSARQAGSDTAEEIQGSSGPGSVIRVRRTDKSSHRLTLDGMSKYNTTDSNPSWADYTGSNKMRLKMTGGCCISIGWDDDVQRDYITIRGFEVTGSGARIRWGGSYSVLENMWVHDVTSLGATVQFNEAVAGSCQLYGIDHDITVRNNLIQRGIGEGIYIAGNYNYADDGGCVSGPNAGDNHYDILIENNTLTDTAINGDQGDGIDLKAGLYNVTVRGNTISFTHAGTSCNGGDGIVTLGQMRLSTHDSNYLIENNVIHHLGCSAGSESSNGMSIGALHSATIRNNIIYNVPGTGIVAWTRQPGATPNNQRIRIYNNTVYGARGGGLVFSNFDDAPVLRNNLLVNNSGSIGGNPPNINSDYNLLSPDGSSLSEGSHSIVLTISTGIVGNPTGGDFHLILGSPAIGKGTDLSATGFATDISGNPRPQGDAWDIGAYEFRP